MAVDGDLTGFRRVNELPMAALGILLLPPSSVSTLRTSRTFIQTPAPAAEALPCRIGRESRSTGGSVWRLRCRYALGLVRAGSPNSEPSLEARGPSAGGHGDGEARVCPTPEAQTQYGITLSARIPLK